MEFVFVVPRRDLYPEFYPQGFATFGRELAVDAFDRAIERAGFFVERARAEREPDWKQVIPYVVVVRDGQVLVLRRTRRGGDARLHEKLSIGVGGHVEPVDAVAGAPRGQVVERCARREIEEELDLGGPYELRRAGWINDDSNSVGAVHVGLVHVLTTSAPVSIREREMLSGEWATPRELRARSERGDDFETWSALLIERLDELLPAAELLVATPAAGDPS